MTCRAGGRADRYPWRHDPRPPLRRPRPLRDRHRRPRRDRHPDVEYKQGDAVLEGYLAYDSAGPARKPGVADLPPVDGGHRPRAQAGRGAGRPGLRGLRRRRLRQGRAPRRPEGGRAPRPGKYRDDRPLLRARAQAALAALRPSPTSSPAGSPPSATASAAAPPWSWPAPAPTSAGVVTFHGSLDTPTPQDAKNIKGKVLVLHGAADPFVPRAAVLALEDELRRRQGGLPGGALRRRRPLLHPARGRQRPSKGAAYNARADRRSWQAMRDFLDEVLGQG